MPTPQEILDQRLASGEITEEDHERLASRLSTFKASASTNTAGSQPNADPATPSPAPSTKASFKRYVPYAIGAVIGLVALANWLNDGLTIGNLSARGENVEFKVSNSTSTTADAVFWVEQEGIEKCSYVTTIQKKATHTIRFNCTSLDAGDFYLKKGWASAYPSRASVSRRIS